MLDQKMLNMLIQNIDILRFSLIFLAIIFITLILWELGLFGGTKNIKIAALPPVAAKSPVLDEKPAIEEDFDPLKSILKESEQAAEEIKVLESSVLDKMDAPKIEAAGANSFHVEDYLSGYQKTNEALVEFEEKSKEKEISFIEMETKEENNLTSEIQTPIQASPEIVSGESSDPWQNMISKSLEESKTTRHKPIKIDLGISADEENK